MGLRPLQIFLLLQCGDRLETSESDVYRRQIVTTKVDPRALRTKALHYFSINHEYLEVFFLFKIIISLVPYLALSDSFE